jgi:Possible lysine decarboxylase
VPTCAEKQRICPQQAAGAGDPGELQKLLRRPELTELVPPCSKLPVPVILVNYDGFYGALMEFLRACDRNGTIGAPELRDVVIASENDEVCCCHNHSACQRKLITSRQVEHHHKT